MEFCLQMQDQPTGTIEVVVDDFEVLNEPPALRMAFNDYEKVRFLVILRLIGRRGIGNNLISVNRRMKN